VARKEKKKYIENKGKRLLKNEKGIKRKKRSFEKESTRRNVILFVMSRGQWFRKKSLFQKVFIHNYLSYKLPAFNILVCVTHSVCPHFFVTLKLE
jgi:hypothetical protein